jgi:hypothetical protein
MRSTDPGFEWSGDNSSTSLNMKMTFLPMHLMMAMLNIDAEQG